MSFDFFEQPDLPPPNNADLADIMKKMEDEDGEHFNFDFDQFDDPNPHDPVDQSLDSDFFPKNPTEKKDSEKLQSAKSRDPSHEYEFENSRDISQISIADNPRNRSFKYQAPPTPAPALDSANQRYLRLQQLLNKAKGNSLDNFYKSLDQQNIYKNEDKFRNKEEFRHYRNDLKAYKKTLEEDYQARNGNYRFSHNHYPSPITYANTNNINRPQKDKQEADNYNFKKKIGNNYEPNNFFEDNCQDGENFFNEQPPPNPSSKPPSSSNPFSLNNPSSFNNPNLAPKPTTSTNFLPTNDFQDDGLGDDYQLKPQDINREIQKYQQRKYQQQAANFFSSEDPRKQRQERPAKKLQTINEQRPNMFQVTQQEQKMARLLNNYQELKTNFTSLMANLKENNSDHVKIIGELKQIKTDYENKESRLKVQEQSQKQRQQARQQQKQEKIKKITEIKQEISKIKNASDKDILILKLNEKVEGLEEMLRNAINELNQEKDPKLVPKIINYYQQPQEQPPSHRTRTSRSSRENPLDFGEQGLLQGVPQQRMDEDFLVPVRNAVREIREERREEGGDFTEEFSSPLQLDLTVQDYPLSLSRGRSQQLEQPFVPTPGSREYQPAQMDSSNKYLRRCLTQKSSVLFQSFEFYVTGKFTVTSNQRFPVSCQIRVANKCAISLYDVFVIVYGPQAQETELEMRPGKVMHDIFKHSTSFLFEVDLGRNCLENGHFSVQISYKSDPGAKKKVNFRALLPFTHLIRPEFIYQEQFVNAWNHIEQEYYVRPRLLDFKNIRSHEDLKLILPFTEVFQIPIQINQADPNCFSYGIMFSFPRLSALFMLKVTCYVSGKASLHLKSSGQGPGEKRLREQTLDILSFLIFG